MAKKILSGVGYFLLYVMTTLLFVYFTFPLDRLQAFIVAKANSSNKYRLEIDGMEREGMGAIVLDGVRVGIHRKLLKRPGATAAPLGGKAGAASALDAKGAKAATKGGKEDDITEQEVTGEEKGAKKSSGKLSSKAGKKGAASKSTKGSSKSEGKEGAAEEEGEESDAEKAESDKVERGLAGATEEDFSFVEIDTLRISFDMFDFLTPANFKIGLDAELLNGTIEGGELEFSEEQGRGRPAIRLPEIYALQLGDAEFFGVLFSALLPSVKTNRVEGVLDRGLIELEPQTEEEHKYYSGRVELELSGIVALAPNLVNRVRNAPAVEVPLTDMRLGKCVFNIKVDQKSQIPTVDKLVAKTLDGTAIVFEKGECKGESLDYFIKTNSYILLPEKGSFMKGKMDLWTKLAFSPDYFDEKRVEDGNVMTRNQELGKGLEFDRTWQDAQDVEGYYWMHCQGSLSQPRCRRELPKEEKAKKDAQKEAERKRKAGKSGTGSLRPGSGSTLSVDEEGGSAAKRESLLEQRREAAKKRMNSATGRKGSSAGSSTGSEEGSGEESGTDRGALMRGGRPTPSTPTFGGTGSERPEAMEGGAPEQPVEEAPADPGQEPGVEEGVAPVEGTGEVPAEGGAEGSVEGAVPSEGTGEVPVEPGAEAPAEGEGTVAPTGEGAPGEAEVPVQ